MTSRALILSLLAASGTAWAEEPASFLGNGDFQTADRSGTWPAEWPARTATASWESEGDNRFLRLRMEGPDAARLTRRLALPKGIGPVRFSYRIRYRGDTAGKPWNTGFVLLECRDRSGKVLGHPRVVYCAGSASGGNASGENTSSWTTVSIAYAMPKGTATLELTPTLYGSLGDQLDVDDIRLAPTTSEDAAEETARIKAARPPAPPADPPLETAETAKWPKELRVAGNRFTTMDGAPVILQGVGVDALQWSLNGENTGHRAKIALESWRANALRIPFLDAFWNGLAKDYQPDPKVTDGGAAYRAKIQEVVTMAANRGAYVILDLHRFGAVRPQNLDAWKQVAEAYQNHPAVLFEIFNEPHGISWEVWRNGGPVGDQRKAGDPKPAEDPKPAGDAQPVAVAQPAAEAKKSDDGKPDSDQKDDKEGTGDKEGKADEAAFLSAAELAEQKKNFVSPGMQAVVAAIRATGAKNLIIAGGLSHAGNLSGIAEGFALEDPTGNGIAYAWHQYWWHRHWDKTVLPVIDKYPVIVTECGASIDKMPFVKPNAFAEPFGWSANFLGFLQEHQLSYTAFSFHPRCGPSAILDMDGTPTPAWGAFVKGALAGHRFPFAALK